MAEFHEQFAWVVVALNAAAGLWVLAANWLEQLRRREMWWFVGVAQLARHGTTVASAQCDDPHAT